VRWVRVAADFRTCAHATLHSTMVKVSDFVAARGQQPRVIPVAPSEFRGRRSEYIARCLEPMLPAASVVEEFHHSLVAYLAQPESVLLARSVGSAVRGQIVRTDDGTRVKWTDNAPAWWWHAVLFNAIPVGSDRFSNLVETTPCEFHEAVGRGVLRDFGWHAAHLLRAKDGNTDWPSWSRRTVVRRFVRSIHPCNTFYVPLAKNEWRRVGGDPELAASVAARYRERYRAIWAEFVDLAEGDATLGLDAPDGGLVIDPQHERDRGARRVGTRWARPPASPGAYDWWSVILQPGDAPRVGRLLEDHPNAQAYTRRLLAGLTVERLVAIADALHNDCRPSRMAAAAPGDPRRQADLAWDKLLVGVNKTHRGSTGWTRLPALLDPGKDEGLAAVALLDTGSVARVCARLVHHPYKAACEQVVS
jgi:hypothetical protein